MTPIDANAVLPVHRATALTGESPYWDLATMTQVPPRALDTPDQAMPKPPWRPRWPRLVAQSGGMRKAPVGVAIGVLGAGLAMTIALLLWGWLWGAIGLILAIPITATIKVICDHIEGWEPAGRWLGA